MMKRCYIRHFWIHSIQQEVQNSWIQYFSLRWESLDLHFGARIDQSTLHTFPRSWNQFSVNCPHLALWSAAGAAWCLSGVITGRITVGVGLGGIDSLCLNFNGVFTCVWDFISDFYNTHFWLSPQKMCFLKEYRRLLCSSRRRRALISCVLKFLKVNKK